MSTQISDPHPPQDPDLVDENVLRAVKDEVQHEFAHIQNSKTPVDSSQSDVLVQKHVNGLVILLFVLVALALLAAIGGIYLYSHAHAARPATTVGVMSHLVGWESRMLRVA